MKREYDFTSAQRGKFYRGSTAAELSPSLLSIRALHLETGLHPKRMRKVMAAAGLLPEEHATLSDGKVLVDAAEGRKIIAAELGALSRPQAGQFLNAPRVQMLILAKSGLLPTTGNATESNEKFILEGLKDFMAKLLKNAKPVRRIPAGAATIPEAAKRACCSAIDIVQAIIEGLPSWVGRLEAERGYMSVLVDVEEMKELARAPEHGGISLREASVLLSTNDRVVQALVDTGHLRSVTVTNPVNRCPQTVVMPDEMERFRATYVSLHELARTTGKGLHGLKKALDQRGISPAFDPDRVGATFYTRASATGLGVAGKSRPARK